MDRFSWFLERRLPSTNPTLCYKEIEVQLNLRKWILLEYNLLKWISFVWSHSHTMLDIKHG